MKERRTAVCAADAVAFAAAGTCTAGTAASAAATATTASAEAPATATTYYRGFGVQCVHRSPQQHSLFPLILGWMAFAMYDWRTENLSAEEEDLAFLLFFLVLHSLVLILPRILIEIQYDNCIRYGNVTAHFTCLVTRGCSYFIWIASCSCAAPGELGHPCTSYECTTTKTPRIFT